MNEKNFTMLAKKIIEEYYRDILGHKNTVESKEFEIYTVWVCKTLQNNKGLFSTTIHDGRYIEVTYNGDKQELYIDIYKKEINICKNNIK